MRRIKNCSNLQEALHCKLLFIDLCQYIMWQGPDNLPTYHIPTSLKKHLINIGTDKPNSDIQLFIYSSNPTLSGDYWNASRKQLLATATQELLTYLNKNTEPYAFESLFELAASDLCSWINSIFVRKLIKAENTNNGISYQACSPGPEVICISSNPVLFIRLKSIMRKCEKIIQLSSDTDYSNHSTYHELPVTDAPNFSDVTSKNNKNKVSFAEGDKLTKYHFFDKTLPAHPEAESEFKRFAETSACHLM